MKRARRKRGTPLIGFIGQGFIGKNYADDFERRGYRVIRYATRPEFAKNRTLIQECDIVFIAVPTPTTPKGFDYSIVREVLQLVGKGKTAVIKSTILPGTTEALQKLFPDIFVMHSPEFLREASAAYDAAHPDRNIVGIPRDTPEYRRKAREALAVLPRAPFERVMPVREAELVKYGGNCFLYLKVVYMNLLYDLAKKLRIDFSRFKEAVAADPRIGVSHMDPLHQSGRGAGGHCFIKDFAAFSLLYNRLRTDAEGSALLRAIESKNLKLLLSTKKDLELLRGVYGDGKK